MYQAVMCHTLVTNSPLLVAGQSSVCYCLQSAIPSLLVETPSSQRILGGDVDYNKLRQFDNAVTASLYCNSATQCCPQHTHLQTAC
jgi:hypothetical protein